MSTDLVAQDAFQIQLSLRSVGIVAVHAMRIEERPDAYIGMNQRGAKQAQTKQAKDHIPHANFHLLSKTNNEIGGCLFHSENSTPPATTVQT